MGAFPSCDPSLMRIPLSVVLFARSRLARSSLVDAPSQEIRPLSASRAEANLVWRCKNCQRESSANIKSGPNAYVHEEPATEQTILTFECRGCDFVDFKPEGEWKATGIEKGGEFSVDLSEGDWYDYDEKVKAEVSVVGVEFRITR